MLEFVLVMFITITILLLLYMLADLIIYSTTDEMISELIGKKNISERVISFIIVLVVIGLPFITVSSGIYYESIELDAMIDEKYANIEIEKEHMDSTLKEIEALVGKYVETEENIIKDVQINNHNIAIIGQLYPDIKSNDMFMELIQSHQRHKINVKAGQKDYNQLIRSRKVLSKRMFWGFFVRSADHLEYL